MSSFDIDFTKTSNLANTPFNHIWGDSSQYSLSNQGLLWGSGPKNIYAAMGIMQPPSGVNAGEGYGLFSFVVRQQPANQPGGWYGLMWRSEDNWLMAANPNMLTELDAWETFDNSAHISATVHFWEASASGNNGYQVHEISTDPTKLHVASYLWAKGSLEYYFDEQLIFSVTGATVPNDAADGGCNYVMGVGAETESSPVGMYMARAKYVAAADLAGQGGVAAILASLVATAGGTATSGSTATGTPVQAPAPLTIASPTPATSAGPVTEKLKVSGPANATLYTVVVGPGPNYSWAGTPQPVTLDVSGNGAVTVSLANGDFVKLGTDASLDNAIDSDPVVITPPTTTSGGSGSTTPSSGSGTSSGSAPTAPAAPGSGTLMVNSAAAQVGGNVTFTWTKATGSNQTVKANINGQYAGTVEDNAPDGGPLSRTLTPNSNGPVVAGANEIDLYIEGGASSAKFSFTASTASTGTTTAPPSYSWAQLTAAVVAALGSSGSSASILATITAAFQRYQAANTGK